MLGNHMSRILLVSCCAFSVVLGPSALAAGADNGKALADRWCSSCHVVDHGQIQATAGAIASRQSALSRALRRGFSMPFRGMRHAMCRRATET